MSKSKSKKGWKIRKNKDKPISATQEVSERKQDSMQGEYAYFRLARSAGGV